MVYHGKVLNGVVVLDGSPLADGTEVRVEAIATPASDNPKPRRGSPEAILPFAGIWADQAEEMDRSLAELRAMKEEEVRQQLLNPEPEL